MDNNKKQPAWRENEGDTYLYLLSHPKKRLIKRLCNFIGTLFLFLGFLSLFSKFWISRYFKGITVNMMLLQLRIPMQGTQTKYIITFILQALLPCLICTAVILALSHLVRKKQKALFAGSVVLFPNRGISLLIILVFACRSLYGTASMVGLPKYLADLNTDSHFVTSNYIVPTDQNVIFPQEKRNLIYIYMESMESTFLAEEQGGQMKEDLMPELYDIAASNISFSDTELIGGSVPLGGMGITSAAMVAQTSGLPLYLPPDWKDETSQDVFLQSTVTLGDILAENGYNQYLMVGSDSAFGARDKYYRYHGGAEILDLFTARTDGIIPADYDNGFWGMEDQYLFDYAKQQLPLIASEGKPFSFTLLTSDTHFPDGYTCSLCRDDFDEPYSNALACSSRQTAEFLEWLKLQDFYENTTVIITGDHLSMGNDYIERSNIDVNQRRVYNAFINTPGIEPVLMKERMFASTDMFPTTLAALGVKIEGDRLGLGTNLFSERPTLLELYGYDFINNEFSGVIPDYNETFNSTKP